MIGQLFQAFNAGGGGLRRGGDLRERQFREISCFTGEEIQWKEWSLKFQAAVKDANPEIYDELKWAASETDELTMDDVREQFGDAGLLHSTMVYNRLITLLSGGALVIHQSVPAECGDEVWRLLHKRYNPMTPMRGIQLMLRVMNPGKVQKGQDINKWEGMVNSLERDYHENITDRMKIGNLIRMMPDELQDVILQHAHRL